MIFDTDVLIWYLRGDHRAGRFIEAERVRSMSIVSLMELMVGARSNLELAAIRQFIKDREFDVVPVSEAISYLAAALIEEYSLGHGLQPADALIAATARHRGESLATGNIRHFKVLAGVRVKGFHSSEL